MAEVVRRIDDYPRPMKVLTATSETQGARDNDFEWTIEGELVGSKRPVPKMNATPTAADAGAVGRSPA